MDRHERITLCPGPGAQGVWENSYKMPVGTCQSIKKPQRGAKQWQNDPEKILKTTENKATQNNCVQKDQKQLYRLERIGEKKD